MMMLDFSVTPYVSVGPIRFDMHQNDLHALLGAPNHVMDSKSGNKIEYWDSEGLVVTLSGQGGAILSIGFGSQQNTASIRKRRFFDRPGDEVYRELCRLDGAPRYNVGLTVLFNLGIMVGGFEVTDQDERTVCAFARGVFKEDDPELRPIKV